MRPPKIPNQRHKYLQQTTDGTKFHALKTKPTKSLYSNAVSQVACPHCNQEAGYYCVGYQFRKVWPPHQQRIMALPANIAQLSRI